LTVIIDIMPLFSLLIDIKLVIITLKHETADENEETNSSRMNLVPKVEGRFQLGHSPGFLLLQQFQEWRVQWIHNYIHSRLNHTSFHLMKGLRK
jgi:hypothetical protein